MKGIVLIVKNKGEGMRTLLLLLLVCCIGSLEGLGDPETNSLIRGQGRRVYLSAGQHNNNIRTPPSSTNQEIEQFNANVTTLIAHVNRACPDYCKEQSQYNGVCTRRGCGSWVKALSDGCSSICNGSEGNYRETYACQLGCSRAIEDYYFRVTGLLGVSEPPTLVSGSLKSTSLRLNWEGSVNLPYLTFCIQRRIGSGGIWETLPLSQALNQTTLLIPNLKPFTQYQFRVGWIVAQDFPPLYSMESQNMETKPQGLPNPPIVTSIQPISNTSVAVTWLPPTQPNGRLIAYILKLQKVPNGHAIIKEIPISQNPRGYTFSSLQPMTNYSLAISAQNLEGEGHSSIIYFVTPQSSISNEVSKSPEPRLLVQGLHDVYLQHMDLLVEPDQFLFTSTINVTGVAVHIKQKLLFVSTSNGDIRRRSLYRNDTITILSEDVLDMSVAFLSVDWLHNKLYIVGKKRRSNGNNYVIKRCELNGNALHTVYQNLDSRPLDFAADPVTGYLYWVSRTTYSVPGGLYKLDLDSNEIGNSRNSPQVVVDGDDLGPFAVDVANYRILLVHKGRNTVLSVSLDGDAVDMRSNTQSPQFGDALSLAVHGGLLYWSSGISLVMEEYNVQEDSYYQNRFDVPRSQQPLGRLLVIHPDTQPTPLPLAPPSHLQVLYGQNRAKITWTSPPSISALGNGAWREWKYLLKISENRTVSNISGTEFSLDALRPSTYYTVQVQAYSETGRGPFSAPNRGKTLKKTPYNITLLWASQSGLYSTNTLGENVELLTSSPQSNSGGSGKGPFGVSWPSQNPLEHHQFQPQQQMSSLAWYDSTVFFALDDGSVYFYRTAENPKSLKDSNANRVRGIMFAQSLAFDYIGQRLYWSNPKQQTIYRCSVKNADEAGSSSQSVINCQAERLQLVTMAKEIAVDSYRGFLLWTTGHSIEMSRMNGYSKGTLFANGLFSGKQIMGMTLDTDQSRVYWITRSSSGSTLQQLNYSARNRNQIPMIIARYDDTTITGPIQYFSDRLIWLEGSSEAVITDLTYGMNESKSKSSLKLSTIENITNVGVRDQGALKWPGGMPKNRVTVDPDSVMKWSVVISGLWNNFTIAWNPVNNTNFGKILYEVILNNNISRITTNPNITIENNSSFRPYTDVEVSITSLTYWSSAKPTVCRLKTPSTRPTEPLNPRIYIQRLKYPYNNGTGRNFGYNISAELRWDEPLHPNGRILGYIVSCWKDSTIKSDCGCESDEMINLSCNIRNLSPSTQYHFAVQAYTDSGAGRMSQKILVDTLHSSPLPKLLITASDKLEILDIDRNQLQPIQLGYIRPLSATFLAKDQHIYWINDGLDLMRAKVDFPSFNKSRILLLSEYSEANHLSMDWIGRKLYWAAEHSHPVNPDFKYSLLMFDLETLTKTGVTTNTNSINVLPSPRSSTFPSPNLKPKVIISSKTQIKSLAVNPFRNALYWTTRLRNGLISLYTAESRDNFTARPFLSREIEGCNCSSVSVGGEPVAYDPSSSYSIIFMDLSSSIYSADENGCNCRQIAPNASSAFSLGADQSHIYWAGGIGYLKGSMKNTRGSEAQLLASGVREVSPFGIEAQPFPTQKECLIPSKMEPSAPIVFNFSAHSLDLLLPRGVIENCSMSVSLPTTRYAVYYGTVDEQHISKCTPTSPAHCKVIHTLEPQLHIHDLNPFTMYSVFVTLTNHYSPNPLICQPIMPRTAPGAPMPPKLLRLEPKNPTSTRVVWRQPEKLNGEKVWYEVNYKSKDADDSNGAKVSRRGIGQAWADNKSNVNRTEFYLDLKELVPDTTYKIWVTAYSEKGDAFSNSEEQFTTTFPPPRNITLVHATPHNLSLRWIPPNDTIILRHQIMYREGWSSQWNFTELVDFTIPGRSYEFILSSLKPKTLYGLRLITWYIGDPTANFSWPIDQQYQFNFETIADKPSKPWRPVARGIGKSIFEVSWDRAEENGAEIEMYALEYKMILQSPTELVEDANTTLDQIHEGASSNSSTHTKHQRVKRLATGMGEDVGAQKLVSMGVNEQDTVNKGWILVYNGTENRWQVTGLDLKASYTFRVRAKNTYGWGEWSEDSGTVLLADLSIVAPPPGPGVVIATILLSSLILAVFALLFIYLYRRKQKEKPSLSHSSSERREVELATLRELPGGSTFVAQSNALYTSGDLVIELDLPGVVKVSWQQIKVKKILGSGAFGDVYEGVAFNLGGGHEPHTRVAIKTLRKGASGSEKVEFMEEAKLMAQFQHPHIIQLLGICVDTDPCYLLLELMGGGDLLCYLRSKRQNVGAATPLNLVDLLQMCVDVAKGCVYLEEMHFVHRDLAARNCLVTNHPESGGWIVKIGDFGLARDIYRNDYYRKDGEGGMLPVRWLAPESLVDGIFTTQSDVWAFGVLLWEIMTLGQQPYPAKSNVEVLNFVREGGRLQAPPHSPHVLGNLMLSCWEYVSINRPSFKDCLSQLELILRDFEDSQELAPLPPLQHVNFDPYSYSDGGSSDTKSTNLQMFPTPPDDPSDSVFLPSSHHHQQHHHRVPKYLEVLSDSPSPSPIMSPRPSFSFSFSTDEGYEIPLPKKPPRQPRNHHFNPNHPSNAPIGLPSSPSYPQYRNLLASSTTEDDYDEHENNELQVVTPSTCAISEHHYLNNNSGSANHLRGVNCRQQQYPLQQQTLFNNHMYDPQSLNSGRPFISHHHSVLGNTPTH